MTQFAEYALITQHSDISTLSLKAGRYRVGWEEEGLLISYAVISVGHWNDYELVLMYTLPGFRQQGYTRKVLSVLASVLKGHTLVRTAPLARVPPEFTKRFGEELTKLNVSWRY